MTELKISSLKCKLPPYPKYQIEKRQFSYLHFFFSSTQTLVLGDQKLDNFGFEIALLVRKIKWEQGFLLE